MGKTHAISERTFENTGFDELFDYVFGMLTAEAKIDVKYVITNQDH